MHSTTVFKSFNSLVWIGDSNDEAQTLLTAIQDNGYELSTTCTEQDLKALCKQANPSFLLLFKPEDIHNSIQKVISAKMLAKGSELTSILICDDIAADDREKYYQAGGDELLISPVGPMELLTKLKHYQKYHKDKSEFNTQLDEASQMALLAMENSSDLGGILNFVRSAMIANTYEDLVEQIFLATNLYSKTAAIEVTGHEHFHYFYSSGNEDLDMKRVLRAQKNSDRVVKENELIQINNQHLVVLLDGLPISDPEKMGRISDTLVMLCDIANRFIQALANEENLSKAESSRRRFLTTLSHELRTPLNGILGFSKTLKGRDEDKPLGTSGIDALNRIFESTNQINAIITTLIDISSASMGPQGLINRSFDVSSLALKLETDFKIPANNKELEFNIDYPDGLTMLSDEKKVYSMLHHLAENAVKFTDKGKVDITITTDFDPTSGQRIMFKVSDTGIGIESRDHKKIFAEVGQLNNEHNRTHYGVGLGLYYVNLLSQQLGGSINIESMPDQGSTFILNLPSGEVTKPLEEPRLSEDQEIDDLLF
jgi:signal transduction histidine kinase